MSLVVILRLMQRVLKMGWSSSRNEDIIFVNKISLLSSKLKMKESSKSKKVSEKVFFSYFVIF